MTTHLHLVPTGAAADDGYASVEVWATRKLEKKVHPQTGRLYFFEMNVAFAGGWRSRGQGPISDYVRWCAAFVFGLTDPRHPDVEVTLQHTRHDGIQIWEARCPKSVLVGLKSIYPNQYTLHSYTV